MSGHEPGLTRSRYGVMCHCTCRRWYTEVAYTTVSGAMCAFGRHLLDVAR